MNGNKPDRAMSARNTPAQAPAAPARRALPLWARWSIAAVLAWVLNSLTHPEFPSLALPAIISFALVLFPLISFVATHRGHHLGILFPAALTWLYFQAPYVYDEFPSHAIRIVPSEHLPAMAWFSAAAILALCSGYYFSFRRTPDWSISKPGMRLDLHHLGLLYWATFSLGFLNLFTRYYFGEQLKPLGQLLVFWTYSQTVACCLAILYVLRGGRSMLVICTAFAFFVMQFLYYTSETLFAYHALLLSAMFTTFALERRRIPWLIFLIVALLMLPLFAKRKLYRAQVFDLWYSRASTERPSLFSRFAVGLDNIQRSYRDWDWSLADEVAEEQGRTRLEAVTYLGQCVYCVEALGVPLKKGATFWWLPLQVVPRLLWPSKPINYHASGLAIEYGLKNPAAKGAMNFPMLAEMYINFGFPGMVILSLLSGVLYRFLLRLTCYGDGDLNLLAFASVVPFLLKVETNINMVFGNIFFVLIFWWLVRRLLLGSNSSRESYAPARQSRIQGNTPLVQQEKRGEPSARLREQPKQQPVSARFQRHSFPRLPRA